MAKKEDAKKTGKLKVKKKNWFKVIAPRVFSQKEIGEMYLSSPAEAIGRTLRVSLRDITGNVKDQQANVGFQIESSDTHGIQTSVISYEIVPSYVKRLVRKNVDRLDVVFSGKTRTQQPVIIKGLLITLNRTRHSTQTSLRKMFEESIREELSKSDFSQFVSNISQNKVQYPLKKKLSKLCPCKEVLIRVAQCSRKASLSPGEETIMPAEENFQDISEVQIEKPSESS